jgi:hypothetical protein
VGAPGITEHGLKIGLAARATASLSAALLSCVTMRNECAPALQGMVFSCARIAGRRLVDLK